MTPFRPKGAVSMREAIVHRFRTLEPGDWISRQDLYAYVEEETGVPVNEQSFRGSCWQAGETLVRDGELGVDFYMGGYRRHDAEALANAAEVRLDRATRDLSRMDTRVNAALARPELPPWWRQRLQQLQAAAVKQEALAARRRNRHRPLPPGEGS